MARRDKNNITGFTTGRRIANREFDQSAFENGLAYNIYAVKFFNAALNRFKWSGLPEGVDERYLELMLQTQGAAVVFFEDALGCFLSLGTAYQGVLDYYGIPVERSAIAANGEPFRQLSPLNSVLIYNNRMHMSDMYIINTYAQRIWDVEQALVNNANMQKYAAVIKTSEGQRLTYENLMMKYAGNQPLIFGDKNLDLDAIQPLDLNIPFVSDKLLTVRNALINDAFQCLGIMSTSSEKRERLTVTESFGAFGGLELTRESYLNERRAAAEKLNKLYGLNVSVEFNSDIPIAPLETQDVNKMLKGETEKENEIRDAVIESGEGA